MKFIKSTNQETIAPLRVKLYKKLAAPIDAMWELLYIASSESYLMEDNNETIGYCCINEEGSLNQIYVEGIFIQNAKGDRILNSISAH